eukprot:6185325-Pleurochrysis_carterae.AAC.2
MYPTDRGQGVQLRFVVAPGRLDAVPAAQATHADSLDAPVVPEYVPAAHGRHTRRDALPASGQ